MAQYSEDPSCRTGDAEARFEETIPGHGKQASPRDILTFVPRGGPEGGIAIDKPISVTETGYGGVSGRGNDISSIAHDAKPGPKLDHKGGEVFTETAEDDVAGARDLLASGKKQEEAAQPVVDQSGHRSNHVHGGPGMGNKVKEFVTGQKPGHGMESSEGLEEWPSNTKAPSAT